MLHHVTLHLTAFAVSPPSGQSQSSHPAGRLSVDRAACDQFNKLIKCELTLRYREQKSADEHQRTDGVSVV